MYAKAGQTVTFVTQFTAGADPVTGIAPTATVWEIAANGTKSPNDTVGTTTPVMELGAGVYFAQHTMVADGVPVAAFATDAVVDLKTIATVAFAMADLSGMDDAIADTILTELTPQGVAIIGRGRGEVEYSDVVLSGSRPVAHLSVKAYARRDDTTVDWTRIHGQDITDHSGRYILFLDPGAYVLSLEKNGTQVTTVDIVVAAVG